MSSKPTEKGIVAQRYIRENPNEKTKTLARRMMKEAPGLFKSLEQARYTIRYYRGNTGDEKREQARGAGHAKTFRKDGDADRSSNSNAVIPCGVKILLFDIETSPGLRYFWRMFKDDARPKQVIHNSKVICWAAKWLGDKEIMFDSIQPDIEKTGSIEGWINTSDKRVCSSIYDLFDEADIVVAHNGRAFDVKILKTRWLTQGFLPPAPYKLVDTLKVARGEFAFPSNRQESISLYTGGLPKYGHEGFGLWIGCMDGDEKAWATMEKYNVRDVVELEHNYMKMRAWDRKHPNLQVISGNDKVRCIVCGCTEMVGLEKDANTPSAQFPASRCVNCGKVMRTRKRYKPLIRPEDRLMNVI